MKISLRWLKDYVNFVGTPAELAEKLTFAGLEVESVTSLAKGLEKVVVGEILERNPHPNADRLSLTKIDVGSERYEIVCGAQNIKAGQKVPVALVGALLPNGMEIKPAKIRGVPSRGMLCSLEELQLPSDWQKEDGIFLLPPETKIGSPLAEVLRRDDVILEINVTPNRGDALSHFGVARDVAALFSTNAKLPSFSLAEKDVGAPEISIDCGKEICPGYYGRIIEGVRIGPSPLWLREKLEAVGLRSVNNVVDITTFVMLEVGQPLHAFDAKKLAFAKKPKMIVRHARPSESFLTLAGKKVDLLASDLVIAFGEKSEAAALAGVMGGKDTEVDDSTTTIFLESANFHPTTIRKTARRLDLLTDAAYRFERGIDSSKLVWALDRASQLILQCAGGVAGKRVGASRSDVETGQIRLRLADIERLLGKTPDQDRVIQIFRCLGIPCEVAAGEQGVLRVQVPPWRNDLKRPVDLVEEVIRIWGFENLGSRLPLHGFEAGESKDSRRRSYFQVRRVRRHLASLGFFEVLNYGFTSPQVLEKIHRPEEIERLVQVANPVTSDFSVMKPSLLSGMLENVKSNFSHKQKDLRLFEMRRVFCKTEKVGKDARLETGVSEEILLSVLMTGAEVDKFWQGKPSAVDFYSLKGSLESVFEMLGLSGIQFQPGTEVGFLHPGQSATIKLRNQSLGVLGRLHPRVEKNFDFDQDVFFAEIRMDALVSDERRLMQFHEYSNFPLVERDFSFLVRDNVTAQSLRETVARAAKPLLRDLVFFDVYRGSRVPEGHVSYAFRVILGASDHTLTDLEINQVQEKIMKGLEKDFQGKFAGIS